MPKIAIIGAGSVVFAQKLISDILQRDGIGVPEFRLMDINPERLKIAGIAAEKTARKLNSPATIVTTDDQREAIRDANYVICCVQVGDTKTLQQDFEIPVRYGLRQTIADTLGIGGIFRALRTYPVMVKLAENIATVGAPRCLLLNYSNPMAMNMLAVLRARDIPAVGLCHSVQGTSAKLAFIAGVPMEEVRFRCAGINHMAFFTEFRTGSRDLYPILFERLNSDPIGLGRTVRFEILKRTGYFVTESSEHQAEYTPYFIHHGQRMIDRYRVSLNELLRRRDLQVMDWEQQQREFSDPEYTPEILPLSHEYGSIIIEAIETGVPATVYGNVLNYGLIDNLPAEACVEVACHVDGTGLAPVAFGRLPTVLAGIVGSNIAVQLSAVEASESRRREAVYHAAMLDPNTSATLTLDEIWRLCDDMIDAQGHLLPAFDVA